MTDLLNEPEGHPTPVETMRRAAALMRKRANAATAEHWEPSLADLLENAAEDLKMQSPGGELRGNWDMRIHIAAKKAFAVARAYLEEA